MGCGSSNNSSTLPTNSPDSFDGGINRGSGPLTDEEIQRRIVCSDSVVDKRIDVEGGGTYSMKIAYLSQKGYYPNGE